MTNRRTKISPKTGRGLGHVTHIILAVRSAILATAWLLVLSMVVQVISKYIMTVYPRSTVSDNALLCMRQPSFLFDMVLQTLASIIADCRISGRWFLLQLKRQSFFQQSATVDRYVASLSRQSQSQYHFSVFYVTGPFAGPSLQDWFSCHIGLNSVTVSMLPAIDGIAAVD